MDNHSYDDIINLPNPTSKNHPRMSLRDRAAQFLAKSSQGNGGQFYDR